VKEVISTMGSAVRLIAVAASIWGIIGLFLSGVVAQGAEPPSLEFIQAALGRQNAASVTCLFTIDYINCAIGHGKLLGKNDSSVSQPVFGDYSHPAPVLYIRTPELLYKKKQNGQECCSARSGVTQVVDCRVRDKQARIGEISGTPIGLISRYSPARLWVGMDRLETIMYPLYWRSDDPSTHFLYGWIKYGKVNSSMEAIDGSMCWKVDVTDTGDSIVNHYEMWLDPHIGFCPRRIKMHGNDSYNGEWNIVIDSTEYKEISPDVWFPARQVMVKDVPKKGLVNTQRIFRAIELTGSKSYTRAQLDPEFEPGTVITVEAADGTRSTYTQQ